jgi:hypothetical protein
MPKFLAKIERQSVDPNSLDIHLDLDVRGLPEIPLSALTTEPELDVKGIESADGWVRLIVGPSTELKKGDVVTLIIAE